MLLESKNSDKKEYGCVMLFTEIKDWDKHLSLIEKEDIYDDENHEHGLEHESHVTLLYGIHLDETKPENIKKFIQTFKPIEVTIDTISIFEKDDYEVVKYDVPPIDEIKKYHDAILANFPNTQTFPEYHPHMTISYVLTGTGKKYKKKVKPFKVIFDTAVYSYKDKKIKIKL
jgi:2'-5' RNA ligase